MKHSSSSGTSRTPLKEWLRDHGLLIALTALFLASFGGQIVTGYCSNNSDLKQHQQPELTIPQYLLSGHFVEATFENWESEFLQMGLYVVLTAALYQKGSAESNPLPEDPDAEHKQPPRPMRYFRTQPLLRKLYENSLSLALFILFLISFVLHLLGGWKEENVRRMMSQAHEPAQSLTDFLASSDFWFQSFQNWQSEFLSIAVIVYLSIYLRQKGSSQSKDVDAPHHETGD